MPSLIDHAREQAALLRLVAVVANGRTNGDRRVHVERIDRRRRDEYAGVEVLPGKCHVKRGCLHQIDVAIEPAEFHVVEWAGIGRDVIASAVVDPQRHLVLSRLDEVGDIEVERRVAPNRMLADVLAVNPQVGYLVGAFEFQEHLARCLGDIDRPSIPADRAVECRLRLVVLASIEIEVGQLQRMRNGNHFPRRVIHVIPMKRRVRIAQMESPTCRELRDLASRVRETGWEWGGADSDAAADADDEQSCKHFQATLHGGLRIRWRWGGPSLRQWFGSTNTHRATGVGPN